MIRKNPRGDLPQIHETAYVDQTAILCGKVIVDENVFIGPYAVIRADEVDETGDMQPIHIGAHSNIQDGVVIHALKNKRVVVAGQEWAVYVGKNVSIAHNALVHGPCYIGDDTFVGFKAVVHDSVVGAHCFIGIGAIVVGVEIPDGKFVPHGMIVDSADAVARLPEASAAHHEFNEDVVDVNRGLAVAYRRIAESGEPDEPIPAVGAPAKSAPSVWSQGWNRRANPYRF